MKMRLSLMFILVFAALSAHAQQSRVRVDSVEPDKTTVLLSCSPGWRAPEGKCADAPEVRVKVRLSGEGAATAKPDRIVTGGRIVAAGNDEFVWYLSGVAPGEYTVSVAAVDSDGRAGESKTVTVKVERCPDCGRGDACAGVKLKVPDRLLQPGETFDAAAETSGSLQNVTFNWTLSAGTIVSGQGTPSITVSTEGLPGGSAVDVNLELRQEASSGLCPTQFSERLGIAELPEPVLIDEFPTHFPCEDGNARLDSLFVELNNNPNDQGVIVIYDSPKHEDVAQTRELLLKRFVRFRRFDPSRITFIRGPYRTEATTQYWRVPPGAENPEILAANADAPPPKPAPTKPYLYAADHLGGLPECDVPGYDVKAYAAVLNAEPASRGRIVIGETSRAKFNRMMREIQAELASYAVPKQRITFVYKYVRPDRSLETTELWIVPPPGKAGTRK